MSPTALQISSYEIAKYDWLLCEVVVKNIDNIKDGYSTNATWRECAFYVPVGTSSNLQWDESNTIGEWQDRVNDVPTWPNMDKFNGGHWVAVEPMHTPAIGAKQRVKFVKKSKKGNKKK